MIFRGADTTFSTTISATHADGTTEQASTFTWTASDNNGRFYIKKSSTNVTTYLDGVLQITETDNLDTDDNLDVSIMVCNANVATTASYNTSAASLSEDAGP